MNFVPIISFDAQQRPLLSRLLKKIRKIIIKSIPLRSFLRQAQDWLWATSKDSKRIFQQAC